MRRVEIVRDVRVKVEEMNAAEADAEGAVVDVAAEGASDLPSDWTSQNGVAAAGPAGDDVDVFGAMRSVQGINAPGAVAGEAAADAEPEGESVAGLSGNVLQTYVALLKRFAQRGADQTLESMVEVRDPERWRRR